MTVDHFGRRLVSAVFVGALFQRIDRTATGDGSGDDGSDQGSNDFIREFHGKAPKGK
ncbi:hypothetical protein D3C85_1882340 [compost metagenome]